ncbi:bacteriocin immunity protein [Companilactobacillus zhachilii]|uniref:Bacteriocin immunity protein n=1 Tax=Companilactobacillus zhachilii TaxID=2304606 RepID=A0A386PQ75_9LACO|nr:bacteriocin immunity protein [Companilactobacillus zhachilii]AYE37352.1 bacteriocin immunity protein [Companilactobacillus zhachilii]
MKNTTLFNLIDASYNEDLSRQPIEYKKCLLQAAQELNSGKDEISICVTIYKGYHDNFIVPMTLPTKNRQLYQYIKDKLNNPSQKTLSDANLGYGLIATHFTFGPFN